jgi:peptide-methionine (S)-S-oxide reductase
MTTAIFAGGCFWGMQELFRHLPGVTGTEVGYTGGTLPNPTYHHLKHGDTGHAEALRITFDPSRMTYRHLLEFFFQIHDPTTPDRQGNDRGSQYRSAIFYMDDAQKHDAEHILSQAEASGKWPGKIVTQLLPAMPFYSAEREHQDYLQRNPEGYTCHWVRPSWKL